MELETDIQPFVSGQKLLIGEERLSDDYVWTARKTFTPKAKPRASAYWAKGLNIWRIIYEKLKAQYDMLLKQGSNVVIEAPAVKPERVQITNVVADSQARTITVSAATFNTDKNILYSIGNGVYQSSNVFTNVADGNYIVQVKLEETAIVAAWDGVVTINHIPENTKPDAPTFTSFNDATNEVTLVPADGVPLADYRYTISTSAVILNAPVDGIINVGNINGVVTAWSIAVAGRDESDHEQSPAFTYVPDNTAPDIEFGFELNNNTATTEESRTLTAKATDPDGIVEKVEFFEVGNAIPIGTFTGPNGPNSSYNLVVSRTTAGLYTFYSVATDDDEATTKSKNVTLNVTNVKPAAPIPNYNSTTRALTFVHPDPTKYPASELEKYINNTTWVAYTPTTFDANAHAQGEIKARVKASPGRDAGAIAESPAVAAVPTGEQPTNGQFTFTVAEDNTATSAAIMDAQGNNIRTLWDNEIYNTGTHTADWDGKNNKGVLMPAGNYETLVTTNKLTEKWNGVMGNTSTEFTGPTIFKSFKTFCGLTFANNYGYFITEYSEGDCSAKKFAINDLGKMIRYQEHETGQATEFITNDGTYIYYAGKSAFDGFWFLYRTDLAGNKKPFTNGVDVVLNRAIDYKGVVGKSNQAISGLAVSLTKDFLFVPNKAAGSIVVSSKTTGAQLGTIAISSPEFLCIGTEGALEYLYIVTDGGTKVQKWQIVAAPSFINLKAWEITTTDICGMDIAPDNSKLIVQRDGNYQNCKVYNPATGAFVRDFLEEGGYRNNALVSTNKVYYTDSTRNTDRMTFVKFQPDGTFWIGDPGNYRILKYSANYTYLDNIMFLPHVYSAGVDYNNPKRMFADYCEFEVDYSKPLGPKNGSWKLVANWGAQVPAAHDNQYNRFSDINTLTNGRRYTTAAKGAYMYELQNDGKLRITNVVVPDNAKLKKDGSLARIGVSSKGVNQKWYRKKLTGFNTANDPAWGTEFTEVMGAVRQEDKLGDSPVYYGNSNNYRPGEVTDSGVYVMFTGAGPNQHRGRHLGGVKLSEAAKTSYLPLFEVAPSTDPNYTGEYPTHGYYDNGNRPLVSGSTTTYQGYTGSKGSAIGNLIIYGFVGEFWKSGQTNYHSIYTDKGLLLRVVGRESVSETEAQEGMGGNAYHPHWFRDPNGKLRLVHNDEFTHSGLHLWEINGEETIKEQRKTIARPTAYQAVFKPGTELLNLPVMADLLTGTAGITRFPEKNILVDKSTNFWKVNTPERSYQRNDLHIQFRQNTSKQYWVKVPLGTVNSPTWNLAGQATFEDHIGNAGGAILASGGVAGTDSGMYIQVLDTADKVIGQFYFTIRDNTEKRKHMMFNNVLMLSYTRADWPIYKAFERYQDFKISMNNGLITMQYAGYSATASKLDATALVSQPKSLRVFCFNNNPTSPSTNKNAQVSFKTIRFNPTQA